MGLIAALQRIRRNVEALGDLVVGTAMLGQHADFVLPVLGFCFRGFRRRAAAPGACAMAGSSAAASGTGRFQRVVFFVVIVVFVLRKTTGCGEGG